MLRELLIDIRYYCPHKLRPYILNVISPDFAGASVDEPAGLDPVLLDHVVAREVRREGGAPPELLLT